jgi:Tol biopolymer transport system component
MNYFAPIVSRDGKQIFVKGAVPRGEVVQYEANSRQFVPYLAGISAESLDFSQDGQLVTYVSYPEGTLWRSRIDGRDRVQLTFSPMRVFLPQWSPDAKRIAFAAKLPGRRWKVYVISASGGRPEQVTHGDDDEGDASWSSATTLVFGTMGVGLQSPTIRSIQSVDLTTRQISTIPASRGLYSPRCSPDGRYIAAMPVEQDRLMIYDFKRKKWAQWPVSNPLFPSWSRDGRHIYFNSALTSEPAFLRVGISDGKVEKVADLKNVRPASSIFGVWSGLTPDDSPLLLRDTGTKEIFALDWQEP